MIRTMFAVILLLMVIFCSIDFLPTNMTGNPFNEPNSAYAMGVSPPNKSQKPANPNKSQKPVNPNRNPIQVPEPSTMILLSTGIVGIGGYLFIKKRKK
ncbi:MAG: PEP-CTERM sorting domain-containing protein [Desulfobacterales bacterium]